MTAPSIPSEQLTNSIPAIDIVVLTLVTHGEGEFGPPGGHLEFGESFEDCAIREVKEEAGFDIREPKFLSLTNDIFIESSKHYVSIFMCASFDEGQEIVNREPEKVIDWGCMI